ncbi:IclR family transcriptional regulator [Paenarthrobacter ureafaciens]|jgi:DNA-binding IclR family transcriptional regulator|uniref:IclR family transcriptional regulator n=1 Tax=Paenarthrobacter ureafaciens TaxID=37931 RepID=UPI0014087327|nr:IclR family transcriptional regulator [Paenarthrobacter ureafaciens]MCX8455630.1 IclR family transcriptional regulator [Paenarthrobacter ureafaciens]MCY0973771.1 IclR family transcriptional regulator [Paenarthrobacter ureafaciens]
MPAKPIKVMANSADLLNALADTGPMSVADIADAISMPRPSVYRLLDALARVGLVGVREDGRAQLGTGILHLADAALKGIPEVGAARSAMQRLNDMTGQTVYLCTLRDRRIVCLDWVEGTKVTLMLLKPGGSLPPHAGATSRAILAYDDSLRSKVLDDAPLQEFTPQTLTSAEQLEADAVLVRERGFSLSDEDVTIGVAALGVPVFDSNGLLRGALSVAGLRDDILPHQSEYVTLLREAAEEVSAGL